MLTRSGMCLQRGVGLPLCGHSRYVGEPEPEQLHLVEVAFVRPVRQEVGLAHEGFEVPFTELDQFAAREFAFGQTRGFQRNTHAVDRGGYGQRAAIKRRTRLVRKVQSIQREPVTPCHAAELRIDQGEVDNLLLGETPSRNMPGEHIGTIRSAPSGYTRRPGRSTAMP